MPPRVRQLLTVAIIAVLWQACAIPARSQDDLPFPAEEWLRGPERRDFPWKVHVGPPRLTFQQRFLVQVRAEIPAEPLQRSGPRRDLHFLLKVADEQGHWFRGEDYNHIVVPPNLDRATDIQFTTGLYLRPGSYVIALIAYDSVLRNGNLWRHPLRVQLKQDPLPQLGRELPAVEFLTDVPRDSLAGRQPRADEGWSLGGGREWLPVQNTRPMRVDVVLNFSNWLDPRMRGTPSAAWYLQRVGRLLQIGSVLSHLDLARGCVQVSGVDIHNLRIIFDRVDASRFDWNKADEKIFSVNQNMVNISTLQKQTATAQFFRRFLSEIMFNSPECGSGGEPARRVMIIAGGTHVFPEGTKLSGVWPEQPCDCEVFYLRADNGVYDQVETMLKPLKPRRFTIPSAQEFRKSLAQLISDLGKPPQSRPAAVRR